MPVPGECSPAIPRACGSDSSMPAASMRRRPPTPFAVPLRSSSSRRGRRRGRSRRSASRSGRWAMERGVAVLVHLARALHTQSRLQRAGPGSRRRRGSRRSCGRSDARRLGSRSSTHTDGAGCAGSAHAPPPAHDPAPHHREVATLGRLLARWPRCSTPSAGYLASAPGPPGAVAAAASTGRRRTGVVAAIAELTRRGLQPCGDLRGRRVRPSMPLAMISAAVAATWGVAIEVPS